MVIPRHRQHPAILRCAEGVGMPDHVHAAIDSGPLAVPHAENAVIAGPGEQVGLLAAPDGGGGQVLVHPRLEIDIVLL